MRQLLAVARFSEAATPPKAVIVPHAGYVYSGPVAASAFAQVARRREEVERVVLLGPAHRVWLEGLAVPSCDAFDTPLGSVPIDRDAIATARSLQQVCEQDAPHREEHSLEVQLPFLQLALEDFRLAPFCVGEASASQVAEVLDLLWGDDETLIVISSDLSHYHDYSTARHLDAETTRAIETPRPDGLDSQSACGRVPISGLLLAARRRGLAVRTLDLRNSGDTAGPRDRVVGYGAYAFG